MAVMGNIGQIRAAIQEGRTAFKNIDFGPEVPSGIRDMDDPSGDWLGEDENPNLFIMSIHKWGDVNKKVAGKL